MGTLKLLCLFAMNIGLISCKPDSKTVSQQSTSVTLTTPMGSLQGTILTSRLGKQIFAFRGIRYAKAPIHGLRFQPPEPIQKWDGVYNATVDGPACPQPADIDTSEDCLFLNVYTTKLPKGTENPKRAVMVFFHGGDFITGSGDSSTLGPKYLLDRDIVLVTPNYRLGPLGFLSTGTTDALGNFGLKDQSEALKWVKAHIGIFGGDADSVTIAGHGSGAASVSLHMLSPLSKGLFHKVIIMSGSAYGNIPVYANNLELAQKVAQLVNCDNHPPEYMVQCLKTKTYQELVQTAPKLREFGTLDPHYIWWPVAEPYFEQEQFLSNHPVALILKDKLPRVPVLGGVTTDEIAEHAFTLLKNQTLLKLLNRNFNEYGPTVFMYQKLSDHIRSAISRCLKIHYLENRHIDNSSLSALVQLYADSAIGFGVYRTMMTMAQKTKENIYYYRFNYKGRYSNFYLPNSNKTDPYGVVHGDDLIYLFHNPRKFPEFKETDPEISTIEKFTTLLANFVQTGNPTPDEKSQVLDNVKWEPYTFAERKFLDIGNKLLPSNNLYQLRYLEWDKLYPYDGLNVPTPRTFDDPRQTQHSKDVY